MISAAWGISLLLWPPWIYAWPYIEGKRTVPEYKCYIQFIETNHYITFGTAIAAFYIPVSIMLFLYYRIYMETEKRQRDLSQLQAGKKESSRRSNSRWKSPTNPPIQPCIYIFVLFLQDVFMLVKSHSNPVFMWFSFTIRKANENTIILLRFMVILSKIPSTVSFIIAHSKS